MHLHTRSWAFKKTMLFQVRFIFPGDLSQSHGARHRSKVNPNNEIVSKRLRRGVHRTSGCALSVTYL